MTPRLLNLKEAAIYLGVSYWTVRDWVAAGHLATFQPPALQPREGELPRQTLRRVLIDRNDLDRFVDEHKRT